MKLTSADYKEIEKGFLTDLGPICNITDHLPYKKVDPDRKTYAYKRLVLESEIKKAAKNVVPTPAMFKISEEVAKIELRTSEKITLDLDDVAANKRLGNDLAGDLDTLQRNLFLVKNNKDILTEMETYGGASNVILNAENQTVVSRVNNMEGLLLAKEAADIPIINPKVLINPVDVGLFGLDQYGKRGTEMIGESYKLELVKCAQVTQGTSYLFAPDKNAILNVVAKPMTLSKLTALESDPDSEEFYVKMKFGICVKNTATVFKLTHTSA